MVDPLWTAADLVAATDGRAMGDWTAITGIAIDTREVQQGDLFIALKGENHDAHKFVAAALEAGAAAAMVHRIPDGLSAAPLLVVDDTMRALQRLGHAGRARSKARVIAVTGSVGKTSTKEMLRAMLAPQGKTHAAVRSFNNHWGVPLTLARMPANADYAVIEIGMNHAGEITPLSKMTRPHVAMITTVEAVHLEHFENVEGIADAKAEIFAGLEADGIAVLNADNPYFKQLSAQAPGKIYAFGYAADDTEIHSIKTLEKETEVFVGVLREDVVLTIHAPGAHFLLNALGAELCAIAAGANPWDSANGLKNWRPVAGRGQEQTIETSTGAIVLLDESYNANPASMRAALAVLGATQTKGRKQAFLGDMLELGPTEAELHAGLASGTALDGVDTVHCCGPRMKSLHDALAPEKRGLWCVDSVKLAAALPQTVDAGDTIMVKGSLGARMAVVVDAIKALGEIRDTPESRDA